TGKPFIRPALLGRPQSLPGASTPLFKQAAQSSPHITIHASKRVGLAVLEIPIPASQRAIDVGHDILQATSANPQGLRPHPFPQLNQALLTWPFHALLEVIPKEVEPSGGVGV